MIFFIFYFFSKNDFFIFLFFLLKMNSLVVFKSQLKELMTQLEVISNKKKNKLLYSKSEIIIINDIYLLLTSFLINDEKYKNLDLLVEIKNTMKTYNKNTLTNFIIYEWIIKLYYETTDNQIKLSITNLLKYIPNKIRVSRMQDLLNRLNNKETFSDE